MMPALFALGHHEASVQFKLCNHPRNCSRPTEQTQVRSQRVLMAPSTGAWFRKWCSALFRCAAQAFAMSLLGLRGALGADRGA